VSSPSNCRRWRDREGDIDILLGHFLRSAAEEEKRPFRLTREAARRLRSYPYPGNVRELENSVRRAVALCPNDMITVDCLPPEIAAGNVALGGSAAPRNEQTILGDRPTMDELQRRYLQLILDENQGTSAARPWLSGWTAEQCNAWLPDISFVLPQMGELEEDLNP